MIRLIRLGGTCRKYFNGSTREKPIIAQGCDWEESCEHNINLSAGAVEDNGYAHPTSADCYCMDLMVKTTAQHLLHESKLMIIFVHEKTRVETGK